MHDQKARHTVIPWLVGLVTGALLTLPVVLKHPRHHFTTEARIFGSLFIWIAFATLIRFLIFAVDWLRVRYASQPPNPS